MSGSRAVLDILRVSWRAGCLKNKTFLIKIAGKFKKCVSLSNNVILNPLARRRKRDVVCFRKMPKTTHCDAFLFHRNEYFGPTGSVELNMAFFDIQFSGTPNPVKNAH